MTSIVTKKSIKNSEGHISRRLISHNFQLNGEPNMVSDTEYHTEVLAPTSNKNEDFSNIHS